MQFFLFMWEEYFSDLGCCAHVTVTSPVGFHLQIFVACHPLLTHTHLTSCSAVILQNHPPTRQKMSYSSFQALDGHKSSGDSGSREDPSSDVFAGSSKEGLLNFRQFTTDKNKVFFSLLKPSFNSNIYGEVKCEQ